MKTDDDLHSGFVNTTGNWINPEIVYVSIDKSVGELHIQAATAMAGEQLVTSKTDSNETSPSFVQLKCICKMPYTT